MALFRRPHQSGGPAQVLRRVHLSSVVEKDFDRVQVPEKPEGERLTSKELNAAVESFLDTLKER